MGLSVAAIFRDRRLTSTVTRRRAAVSLTNHGEERVTYDAGTPVKGIVGPASQADLEILPEGTRLSDSIEFITAADVRPGTEKLKADVLVNGTDSFLVLHREDWVARGYVRCVGVRFPTGESL